MASRTVLTLVAATMLTPGVGRAWEPADAVTVASSFANQGWYCSSANHSNGTQCLSTWTCDWPVGSHTGECYKAGGFDLPAYFITRLADGAGAGSNLSDGYLTCVTGIDCSGLVSRAWNLSSHAGTLGWDEPNGDHHPGLGELSFYIAPTEVTVADIWLALGQHVVLMAAPPDALGRISFYEAVGYPTNKAVLRGTEAGYTLASMDEGYIPRRNAAWNSAGGLRCCYREVDGTYSWTVESAEGIAAFRFATSNDGRTWSLWPGECAVNGVEYSHVAGPGATTWCAIVAVGDDGSSEWASVTVRPSLPAMKSGDAAGDAVSLDASVEAKSLDGAIVVIAPWSWYRVLNGLLDYWRASCGYTVYEWYMDEAWREAYLASSSSDYFRDHIKDVIAGYAAQGAKYVVLVGDYNNWRESGYEGQKANDVLPTYTFPHPAMSWSQDLPYYFSDHPYGDTNEDGLPELAVGRIPVTSDVELGTYIQRLIAYDGNPMAADAGVRVIGYSYDDPAAPRGAEIVNCATDSMTIMSAQCGVARWYRYAQEAARNTASAVDLCAQMWTQERPSLVIAHGVWSSRYHPAGLLTWDMLSRVSDNNAAVVVAASCGGANYAQTQSPPEERPVCERALLESGRAVLWVGPTGNSEEWGNYQVVKSIMAEIAADKSVAVGEAVRLAVRRVCETYGVCSEMRDVAMSYQVLGVPIAALRNHHNGVSAIEEHTSNGMSISVSPIPCRSRLAIRVDGAAGGMVRMGIYDLRGRRVREWVHDASQKQASTWNVTDQRGQRVASGVYVLRVEREGGTGLSRRIVVRR